MRIERAGLAAAFTVTKVVAPVTTYATSAAVAVCAHSVPESPHGGGSAMRGRGSQPALTIGPPAWAVCAAADQELASALAGSEYGAPAGGGVSAYAPIASRPSVSTASTPVAASLTCATKYGAGRPAAAVADLMFAISVWTAAVPFVARSVAGSST